MRPQASVVIPVRGAPQTHGRVLRAVLAQVQARGVELIVASESGPAPLSGLPEQFPRCVQFLPPSPVTGRGAAINRGIDRARGELLLVLDGDILPGPNWLAEHLRFHERHPERTATHLGQLAWTTEIAESGSWLAELLGPRDAPGLFGWSGGLPWTLWSTDNWSAKRELLESPLVRFFETSELGVFDDSELVLKLVERGATAELSGEAAALRLGASDGLDLLRTARRSAERLVQLRARYPERPELSAWISLGYSNLAALEAGERFLEALLELAAGLFARGARLDGERALRERLAADLARALFQVGIARSLWDAGLSEPCEATASRDAEQALDLAALAAPLYLTGAVLGQEQRVAHGVELALGGLAQNWKNSPGFLGQLTGHVDFEFQRALELVQAVA